MLVKSGDFEIDKHFSDDCWDKRYRIIDIYPDPSSWGVMYHATERVNTVEAVMVTEEIYNSPLFQALR